MRPIVLLALIALPGCALFQAAPPAPAAAQAVVRPAPKAEASAAFEAVSEETRRHADRQAAIAVHGAQARAVPQRASVPALPAKASTETVAARGERASGAKRSGDAPVN